MLTDPAARRERADLRVALADLLTTASPSKVLVALAEAVDGPGAGAAPEIAAAIVKAAVAVARLEAFRAAG